MTLQRGRYLNLWGLHEPFDDPRLRLMREAELAVKYCLDLAWFCFETLYPPDPSEMPSSSFQAAPTPLALAALLRRTAEEIEFFTETL